jgi:hypothetical protein
LIGGESGRPRQVNFGSLPRYSPGGEFRRKIRMYLLERLSTLFNEDVAEGLQEAESERQMEEVGIAQELAGDLLLGSEKNGEKP